LKAAVARLQHPSLHNNGISQRELKGVPRFGSPELGESVSHEEN